MASMVVNALAPHVVRGARMGLHWAAPRASAALNKTVEASHAARDFVRELAVEKFDGLTEAEYRDVVHHESSGDSKTEPNLIDFSDGEADELVTASKGDREQVEDELKTEPRRIRLHCRNIRASRDIPHMEALGAMTPRFSHWCVEVDGLFCELRAANPGNSLDFKSDDGRIVEHQELGEVNRKIKLGITTNRQMHANARSYDVGNTILHNQQIIKIGIALPYAA
ncbi:MAG: hypothetical protein LQ342_006468 [Letrouitia transgressa]|nr:MAG: hypothetical protein LQ342_006468 [Letrouitia transgressa]